MCTTDTNGKVQKVHSSGYQLSHTKMRSNENRFVKEKFRSRNVNILTHNIFIGKTVNQ